MRTDEEILARIAERKQDDFLGFEVTEYIACLGLKAATPFLSAAFLLTGDPWTEAARDRDSVVARMLAYMTFAWEKANGCRGISANRSVSHFQAWMWLVGDEEIGDRLFDDYEFYGKLQLVRICEHYGWDWRQWDDGDWRNDEEGAWVTADQALGRVSR